MDALSHYFEEKDAENYFCFLCVWALATEKRTPLPQREMNYWLLCLRVTHLEELFLYLNCTG